MSGKSRGALLCPASCPRRMCLPLPCPAREGRARQRPAPGRGRGCIASPWLGPCPAKPSLWCLHPRALSCVGWELAQVLACPMGAVPGPALLCFLISTSFKGTPGSWHLIVQNKSLRLTPGCGSCLVRGEGSPKTPSFPVVGQGGGGSDRPPDLPKEPGALGHTL